MARRSTSEGQFERDLEQAKVEHDHAVLDASGAFTFSAGMSRGSLPMSPPMSSAVLDAGGEAAGSSRDGPLRGDKPETLTSHHRADVQADETTPLDPEACALHTHQYHIEHFYTMKPEASVYSFHLMMAPLEMRRSGSLCTWVMFFALGLIFVNFVMQFALVYVVNTTVVKQHEIWRESIVRVDDHPWYQINQLLQDGGGAGSSDAGSSLCHSTGDQLTCSPSGLQLFRNWNLLDRDGDDVWTRAEAENEKHRTSSRSEYGIDVLLVYDGIVRHLQQLPALAGRMDSNLTSGVAVHRAYYDWYKGEPLLCMYGDEDMCGNLFNKGVFDGAIRHGANLSGNIYDLQSAKNYCTDLLRTKCNTILPASYRVWRMEAEPRCGAKIFSKETYDSPDKDPNNVMAHVEFEKVNEFVKWQDPRMFMFLGTLLLSFFLIMYAEWKSMFRFVVFVIQNREIHKCPTPAVHRWTVLAVIILRFVLWIVVLFSGTLFLTSGTNYMNMIFDALSLVFIITIDEVLYATLLRGQMVDHHSSLDTVALSRKPLCMSVYALEVATFTGIVFFTAAVVFTYMTNELRPIHDALQCVCLTEGSSCYEATTFSKAWWDEYWQTTRPEADLAINGLIAAASATA